MSRKASDLNPFATRFIRPGAVPFLFDGDASADTLVADLAHHQWWGQIIGAHGSGKSTLVAALVDPLTKQRRRPVQFALHDGQRTLPLNEQTCGDWDSQTQVIVDGYEQLSRLNRNRLKSICRRKLAGLLVTAHTNVGLPPLWQTSVTEDIAWRVVTQLMAGQSAVTAQPHLYRADTAASLQRHGSDLREVLFELYDLYEQRRE